MVCLKFSEDYPDQQTPEEGWRAQQPKHWDNKDENNKTEVKYK